MKFFKDSLILKLILLSFVLSCTDDAAFQSGEEKNLREGGINLEQSLTNDAKKINSYPVEARETSLVEVKDLETGRISTSHVQFNFSQDAFSLNPSNEIALVTGEVVEKPDGLEQVFTSLKSQLTLNQSSAERLSFKSGLSITLLDRNGILSLQSTIEICKKVSFETDEQAKVIHLGLDDEYSFVTDLILTEQEDLCFQTSNPNGVFFFLGYSETIATDNDTTTDNGTDTTTDTGTQPSLPSISSPEAPASKKFNADFNIQLTGGSEEGFKEFRYSLDGTSIENCESGVAIQPGIDIVILAGQNRTLTAVSCDQLGNKSSGMTRTYLYDSEAPGSPTTDDSKVFNASFSVQLSGVSDDFKEYRYTLDGNDINGCSEGISASTETVITIPAASTTLKAIACDLPGNASPQMVKSYTYDGDAPAAPGATADLRFNATFNVSLTGGSEGDFASFRYTLDGGDIADCNGGTEASGAIAIPAQTTTLKAVSCDTLGNMSAIVERTYTFDNTPPASPGATPGDQNFAASFTVDLSNASESDFDEFVYTLDGSTPTCAGGGTTTSSASGTNITIPLATTTLKAVACDLASNGSTVSTFQYGYIDLVDDDNTATGFAGGTHNGTEWNGSKLVLSSSTKNEVTMDASWTPKWDNVVLYVPMDGDWTDGKGSNDTPTISNDSPFSTTSKVGSHAGDFDGTDDYISWQNLSGLPLGNAARTYSIWVNVDTFSTSSDKCFICQSGGSVSSGKMINIYAEENAISFAIHSHRVITPKNDLKTNTWYHFVLVIPGGVTTADDTLIYINGVNQPMTNESGSNAAVLDTDNPHLQLGSSNPHSTSDYFDGQLDEFALWDVALTEEEINAIYKRQAPNFSGTYTSRVMDAEASTSWTSASWKSTLPFGRELTAAEENTSNYSAASTTLDDDLVALWHFNNNANNSSATTMTAGNLASGASYNPYGKFNHSIRFDGTTNGYVDFGDLDAVDPGTNDFTVSAWFKTMDSNFTLISKSKYASADNRWALLGGGGLSCLFQGENGQAGTGGTSEDYEDGNWHHAVCRFDRDGNVQIFVDGVAGPTGDISANSGDNVNSGFNLIFGKYNSSTGDASESNITFTGEIDEAAIWHRALSNDEITELYHRGAANLKLQVRSCTTSNCSNDPDWQGTNDPDDTNGLNYNYFTQEFNYTDNDQTVANDEAVDSGDSSISLVNPLIGLPSFDFSKTGLNTSVPSSQYFQYRIILETEDSTNIPVDVESVSIIP